MPNAPPSVVYPWIRDLQLELAFRMDAATKPQVLGLLLFLLALAVEFRSWALVPVLLVCWIFQLLTSRVSADMVGRAGYRTRHMRRDLLTIDELGDVVEKAARQREDDRREKGAQPDPAEHPFGLVRRLK